MSDQDSAHITAVKNQLKLAQLAKTRRRIIAGKVETYEASPAPDLETAVAAARAAEARLIADTERGQLIPGRGVFIGTYAPKDFNGNSLGKIFNVFAAPTDLVDEAGERLLLTFNEALTRIAGIKNLCGHDGGKFRNATGLYKALKNGRYKGEWFMPNHELLTGEDRGGTLVQPDNLRAHADKGVLKGTFSTQIAPDFNIYPGWYWSSSVFRENSNASAHAVRFSDGEGDWFEKNGAIRSCRPVRLEEVTP